MKSDEEKRKAISRSIANIHKQDGRLALKPCEKCGAADNVEMHHEDYSKPLDVRFFCRPCHNEHHHAPHG